MAARKRRQDSPSRKLSRLHHESFGALHYLVTRSSRIVIDNSSTLTMTLLDAAFSAAWNRSLRTDCGLIVAFALAIGQSAHARPVESTFACEGEFGGIGEGPKCWPWDDDLRLRLDDDGFKQFESGVGFARSHQSTSHHHSCPVPSVPGVMGLPFKEPIVNQLARAVIPSAEIFTDRDKAAQVKRVDSFRSVGTTASPLL
jgi:hypothetical protein